ncbi:MAG: alpha/beta hydrolase [Burkholderiaceae bacterium]|nr:alpha/beta hydrolase [Burkholderiaceae bacterium]
MFAGFRQERRRANGITINLRHGGSGPPLLLLHGFPQTHAIWHKVAPQLAEKFTLVMPDLRGYGDSDKPDSSADHAPYSKRTMARDAAELMRSFGFERFLVAGHDRGGRVAHRLAVDHPRAVERLMVLDISPTLTMYEGTTMQFAAAYYHWFFLIQPEPLPERLIAADPLFYLHRKIGAWGSAHAMSEAPSQANREPPRGAAAEQPGGQQCAPLFDPRALAEYERCFTAPAVHAMCEDYRAAASIDLEHDRADLLASRLVECPVSALWGKRGVVDKFFTPLADWQERTRQVVTGRAMPSGHYIAEEVPELLNAEMQAFFAA